MFVSLLTAHRRHIGFEAGRPDPENYLHYSIWNVIPEYITPIRNIGVVAVRFGIENLPLDGTA